MIQIVDKGSKNILNWSRFDAFVSEDQFLIFIDIQLPTASLMEDTAWVRVSRGVTQLAQQTINFESSIRT